MKKFLLLTICILFIGGCAGQRRDMTKDYHKKYTYHINKNYQRVYRDMLKHIRESYRLVWVGSQSIIENDLYPDIKYGKIRATNETIITGEWCQTQIEIEEIENDKSELTIYTSKHGFTECLPKETINEWIKDIK